MSDRSPLPLCKVSTTTFYPSLVEEKIEKLQGLLSPASIKTYANYHTFKPTKETYEHLSQTRLENFQLCILNEQKSYVQQTMEESSRMDRQMTNRNPFHAGRPEIHNADEARKSLQASLKHEHPKADGRRKHSQHLHPSLYYFISNSIKNCRNPASGSFRSTEPSTSVGKDQQRDHFRFLPYSIPFRTQEGRPTEGFSNEKSIEKIGCVRLPESRRVSKSQGTREEARQGSLGHANIIQDSASNSTNNYQRGRLALEFPQTPSRCSRCMIKALPKRARKRPEEVEQVCVSCSTDNTPEWRRGPTGPRTLCNACGLQYSKQCLIKKKSLLANGEYIKGIDEGKVDDFTAEEREDNLAELRKRCNYLRSLT